MPPVRLVVLSFSIVVVNTLHLPFNYLILELIITQRYPKTGHRTARVVLLPHLDHPSPITGVVRLECKNVTNGANLCTLSRCVKS